MELVVLAILAFWVIYIISKIKRNSAKDSSSAEESSVVSTQTVTGGWEEEKKHREESLVKLKSTFEKRGNVEEAIALAESAVREFVINHECDYEEIKQFLNSIKLPEEIEKRELTLRQQINQHYKNREDKLSKSISIYLALKHALLQMDNNHIKWKSFLGLNRLRSNLKDDEYYEGLLNLMFAFQERLSSIPEISKLSSDIEGVFAAWNRSKIRKSKYEQESIEFKNAKSASDKHFLVFQIIEYLMGRYKVNPKYRDELISWCMKDVKLYEQFLTEFHEIHILTDEKRASSLNKPTNLQEKKTQVSFEKVKRLKSYWVPRLNSYEVLQTIYEKEQNTEKLSWLNEIGRRIGYVDFTEDIEKDSEYRSTFESNFKDITRKIEFKVSGQKGKHGFINSKNEPCSTEDAFKEYFELTQWTVLRAEVTFWEAMFCLSFWDEIYDGMGQPVPGQDIPPDLYGGDEFYLSRKSAIDSRFEEIKTSDLRLYVNNRITSKREHWTRLLYVGERNMFTFFETDVVQSFLDTIKPDVFAKVVYRIAKNPSHYRSGVPDFVIWRNGELKMVEVKRLGEKVGESQKIWMGWMLVENIPIEIVRIKGI